MRFLPWVLTLLFYLPLQSFGQHGKSLPLNRHLYPIEDYNYVYQHMFETDSALSEPGGSTYIKAIDGYKGLRGADYADDQAKFTIAVNLTPINGKLIHQVYLAPYKADSVYISFSETQCDLEDQQTNFVIEVGKYEYSAMIDADMTVVTITNLKGPHVKPNIRYYNNRLPDTTKLPLLGGGKVMFNSYEHKDKYIYVMLWYENPMSTTEINLLQRVSDAFKDKLTSIIIVGDTAAWISQNISPTPNMVIGEWYFDTRVFQLAIAPSGALFDSDGNIINRGILPSQLQEYLQKLIAKKNE